MSTNSTSRITAALSIAIGIFLIAVLLPQSLFSSVLPGMMTTQGLELVLSLLAIVVFGKSKFAEYGFCLPGANQQPVRVKTRWIRISMMAPLLGVVATPLILGLGGRGNPLIKDLSFPQIVLFVWIFSSIIEEVFTRGFLQGHLTVLSGKYFKLLFIRIEMPVMISAVFFACMHFVLLSVGIDAITMTVVFLFTLSIGLMAGHLRARTGSLIPAIVVHILANIGGMIGGVIFTFASFLITGELPSI